MAPSGYTGTAIWGSNAVVDARRKSVFIGTGNNYSTPTAPGYVNCILAGGTPKVCLSPDDHVESIVALDAGTGRIKWSQRLTDGDDWNVACNKSQVGENCPVPTGVDFDFGSAPNEFSVRLPKAHGHQEGHRDEHQDIIGAGQKSGVYSAFDPDTGDFLWGTQVGPGGDGGGGRHRDRARSGAVTDARICAPEEPRPPSRRVGLAATGKAPPCHGAPPLPPLRGQPSGRVIALKRFVGRLR
jgi:polyvinyl alcohol dehydrogenase (cytochrome)